MTAKDAISPYRLLDSAIVEPGVMESLAPAREVEASLPLLEVLPLLLDAPGRRLRVTAAGSEIGVIDSRSMLEALGRMIAPRDDSSVIEVECAPGDYSASHFAMAVEDADAHLVDLFSAPASDGKIRVTLRVRHSDPTMAVHSLERYGFEVVNAWGAAGSDPEVSRERLSALQAYLNV